MSFKHEQVDTFLQIFYKNESKISQFEGCLKLELLRDYHKANVYYTYSYWKDDSYLEKYRNSDLFQKVWQQTKILFSDKPMAFSLKKGEAAED